MKNAPCRGRTKHACRDTNRGPWSVCQDIFRKYPNRYEKIIGTLCENLETLDEPEAKVCLGRLPRLF